MTKNDKMLLIEARDPERRDIAQIVADLYRETGSLRGVCKAVETKFQVPLTIGTLSTWIDDLRGRRVLEFPEGEKVPA